MIIVDRALKLRAEAGNPVRVGLIGSGFMGRGIINQIVNCVPGMKLVAVANRHAERAADACREAGVEDIRQVATLSAVEDNLHTPGDHVTVTDDATLLCQAHGIDALVEATGTIEFAAGVVLEAITYNKHVLLMNAELDATLGSILKVYADRAGVILSGTDGDHPGVQVNLYRFVCGLGMTPLLCGTVKGLYDPLRTPATQQAFAEAWGQQPHMVTSYADGTKMSFEQASVANATGMTVAQRGMLGHTFNGSAEAATGLFDADALTRLGGVVDYLVGAQPSAGVFVYAKAVTPAQCPYLEYLKLGEGPLYCFTTPYHLCHMEVPFSVARAVLFGDAVMAPLGAPTVEVVALAKRDLKAGETLDGIGGYLTYGVCERARVSLEQALLPMGISGDCRLIRDVPQHNAIRYADVILPEGRLSDRLRTEQNATFSQQVAGGR